MGLKTARGWAMVIRALGTLLFWWGGTPCNWRLWFKGCLQVPSTLNQHS